jgi:hypothetical protein
LSLSFPFHYQIPEFICFVLMFPQCIIPIAQLVQWLVCGRCGPDSRQGQNIFLFSKTFRPALLPPSHVVFLRG